jgi:hypothetical protein
MASSEVSINQLPITNQISNGDFIIVQSPNNTSRLDFRNFVVGLDNTTFSSTITDTTTDLAALSSVVFNGQADPAAVENAATGTLNHSAIKKVPITIKGETYVLLLSATSTESTTS